MIFSIDVRGFLKLNKKNVSSFNAIWLLFLSSDLSLFAQNFEFKFTGQSEMGKDKLKKWAENKTFPHVYEPNLIPVIREGATFMKGEWGKKVFRNNHPITIELGCGKGEYTVGLARRFPERNFIGVDVKGHRFHKGAKESYNEKLGNVAFLRARIEFIEAFFGENEVDEIWLTFSDPQPKDERGIHRITSVQFLEKYKNFLKPGGRIHVKHDNPLIMDLLLEELEATRHVVEAFDPDIYGPHFSSLNEEQKYILGIRTYYEQMWIDEGKKIQYLRYRVVN